MRHSFVFVLLLVAVACSFAEAAAGDAIHMAVNIFVPVDSCDPAKNIESSGCEKYVVQKGDTLFSIAKRQSVKDQNLTVKMLLLLPENIRFRKNPDLIFPGQTITLPIVTMAFVPLSVAQSEIQKLRSELAEKDRKLGVTEIQRNLFKMYFCWAVAAVVALAFGLTCCLWRGRLNGGSNTPTPGIKEWP